MDFKEFFTNSEEYPEPTSDMLPLGKEYEYISSTFLNGWINYVNVKAARLISRYCPHETNQAAIAGLLKDPPFHFDFGQALQDDLLILARGRSRRDSRIDSSEWWFFWYDRDCSDCCIGRFSTEESDESVLASFVAYSDDRSKDMGYENSGSPSIEVPLSLFRGWISG